MIHIFLHLIDSVDGHENIALEIVDSIENAGLLDVAFLHLFCNYKKSSYDYLLKRFDEYENVRFVFDSDGFSGEYEMSTINAIKNFCKNNLSEDDYVLYLHHKGVTRAGNAASSAWREYMLYFNVVRWRDCIAKLNEGFDVVGVNYHALPYPHFSGNFWWGKPSYLKNVPQRDYPDHKGEFWLFKGNPKFFSLHDSNVDHYKTVYERKSYEL